jgi:hypothetical protein
MKQLFRFGRHRRWSSPALPWASRSADERCRNPGLAKEQVGTKQLKKNAVISSKVKNGSLLRADFKSGQIPAGPRGPAGPAGPTGPAGVAGTPGQQGPARSSSSGLQRDGRDFESSGDSNRGDC